MRTVKEIQDLMKLVEDHKRWDYGESDAVDDGVILVLKWVLRVSEEGVKG